MEYISQFYYNTELYHHGVLGQKWGVRRYQNADGSLTSKGKKHIKDQDILDARKRLNERLKEHSSLDDKEAAVNDAWAKSVENNPGWDINDPRHTQTKEYKKAEKAYNEAKSFIDKKYKTSLEDDMMLANRETGKEKSKRILSNIGSVAASVGKAALTSLAISALISVATKGIKIPGKASRSTTNKQSNHKPTSYTINKDTNRLQPVGSKPTTSRYTPEQKAKINQLLMKNAKVKKLSEMSVEEYKKYLKRL